MSIFDKIIGYEMEKEELKRLCDVLKNREKYLNLGVKPPKALLLYGEPGVGKTLMAKAFIAETGRKAFYCKKDSSDGEFVTQIKEVFEQAKKEAPSVILFDDMDKFAEDNLQQNCNKEEFVAIQSGLEDIRETEVFVIATANDINNLPDSLMREGRFGRRIEVCPPDYDNSVKIIRHYLQGKNISQEVSAEILAYTLQGNSCAALEEVINEAGMYAGYEDAEEIRLSHINRAILRVLCKTLPVREKNAHARELAAYHEAGHALASLLLGQEVCYVSIYNYGDRGGVCFSKKRELERSFEEEHKDILIFMAGKASVELNFKESATGTGRDMRYAWEIIVHQTEATASYGFEYCNPDWRSCSQSPALWNKSADKITRLMEIYYLECRELLAKNKNTLDKLAQALLEKDVLFYDEIVSILSA